MLDLYLRSLPSEFAKADVFATNDGCSVEFGRVLFDVQKDKNERFDTLFRQLTCTVQPPYSTLSYVEWSSAAKRIMLPV